MNGENLIGGFMRFICTLLFLASVSATAFSQSTAPKQTENANQPFTLEMTASHVKGHTESWDFANCAETSVRAGTVVVVRIRKSNTSESEIAKWSDVGLTYEVRKSNGNLIAPRGFNERRGDGLGGGEARLLGTKDMVLQPNESKAISAPISNWYDELAQPGTYTIQISEHVSNDPTSPIIKSNKITITVVPQ